MKAYYENRQNVNLIKIQKMFGPLQEKIKLKNLSFKPTFNKNFKLSGNLNNINSNFKNTVILRGENNKGRNLKFIEQKEKGNSEDTNQKELIEKDKKQEEIKIIKEIGEEEEEKKEKNEKSNDKVSQKEIEIKLDEKETDMLKATRHIREYYKDRILQRMANSVRMAELLQTNEENSFVDENSGRIDEIAEIEGLEVEDSRIRYEEEEDNEEKEKSEDNINNEDSKEKSKENNNNEENKNEDFDGNI